jgi:hypothetical protein
LVFLLPVIAFADREVTVPQGKKIRDGVWRVDTLFGPSKDPTRIWLGTGFAGSYDLEFTGIQDRERPWRVSLDASYNYSPPIIDVAPGISVGVQDAMNATPEGRALYVATTFRFGNVGELNQDVPTELTLGFWSRKEGVAFFGASLPITDKVVLVAEHNSHRLAGAVELRPFAGLRLKSVFESDGTLLSVSLSRRF